MPDPPARNRGKWSEDHEKAARAAGFISWSAWCEQIEQALGYKVCGAMKPRKGEPCGASAGAGTSHPQQGRCKHHFGNNPVGYAAPTYRDGRYGKHVPDRLRPRWEELDQAGLVTLLDEIRVGILRQTLLLERLDTGETESGWGEARSAYSQLRTAFTDGDAGMIRAVMQDLHRILNTARQDRETWDEIRVNANHIKGLMDSQTRMYQVAGEFMARAEVLDVFAKLADGVREIIRDPGQLDLIQRKMRDIMGF